MTREIDWTKQFIPERLTPLYHTSSYGQLSAAQRLRYNQLHGCYFNEQVIFFESAMAEHILLALLQRTPPPRLAEGLRTFIAEEKKHSEMFRNLNRRCQPPIYTNNDFHFIQVSAFALLALRNWVRRAGAFPFFVWILLIQEERSLFCSKQYLAHSEGLEPNFLEAQRLHLADEVGHIQW